MQRRLKAAVALALGTLGAPAATEAQSSRGPAPDTPRLLVAVFAAPDRVSGVQVADAVRNRINNSVNPRFLYVVPKNDIVNYLESSGYKADSSLGTSDLKELARLLRAAEIVFGTVSRAGTAWKVESRLALARDPTVAQPLPTQTVTNLNDAGREIERALADARKQLVDNQACENGLRDQQYQRAIAAANQAISKYPNATMARTCLASAYQAMKLPADSVLRVANEIVRLDPMNSWGYRFQYGAFKEKGDNENAVRALVKLVELEPTNFTLRDQVISELAQLGKPAVAIPIVDTMLTQTPGDPQLLRQRWLLTLAAAANAMEGADTAGARAFYEQALTAGENMIRSDTAQADSVFYTRQLAAAYGISPQRGAEFAARAVQRFPNNAEFWAIKAQAERRGGQLQMAEQSIRRALQITPNPQYRLLHAQTFIDMGMPDSALAIARAGVAAGEDAKNWGTMILAVARDAFAKAQESKATADWEKALMLAEESDKLAPSAAANFFIGVGSFSIVANIIQDANKAKSCPMSRRVADLLVKTQIAMPKGAPIEQNTARQIMQYAMQYSQNADQMVKAYCK